MSQENHSIMATLVESYNYYYVKHVCSTNRSWVAHRHDYGWYWGSNMYKTPRATPRTRTGHAVVGRVTDSFAVPRQPFKRGSARFCSGPWLFLMIHSSIADSLSSTRFVDETTKLPSKIEISGEK